MDYKIIEIVKRAYDLHVHIGPEVIPRKFTAQSLEIAEKDNLAGCVLKNHYYSSAAMFDAKAVDGIELFGSVVLNNSVGGMNSEAIFAASFVSKQPILVWFPTINSEQFLRSNKYEIAPEWVEDKSLKLKPANEVRPVMATSDGELLPKTKKVIETIALVKGVLATGHIAAKECILVAQLARSMGVPVIITHPIYQHISMTIEQQKYLAGLGCFIEQTYSMYSMDSYSIAAIADQIKAVGPRFVVLSSDVGQKFSPKPSEALAIFAKLLVGQGFTLKDIETMMIANPKKVLGIQ
jgi:hypothetical protein